MLSHADALNTLSALNKLYLTAYLKDGFFSLKKQWLHFVVISIKLFFFMSALRLPEAAKEQHNLETSANPATCWSVRGSICPPTVRFNLFAFISTHPILLHRDAHCTWQRNTAFVNHYLLINIYYVPLILRYFTVPVYNVLVFSFSFFFFKVYLLHNWWLLMTFSKWGKLLMIFKFIFIRVNELP